MTDYIYILVQMFLITGLTVIAFLLFKLQKILRKEKRLTKFSVSSITEKPVSFFDKLEIFYLKIIKEISKTLTKSKIFVKFSKKYDIYVDQTKIIRGDSMDFISHKLLIALITISVTILSDILRVQPITILQILFSTVVGFYIPDIFLFFERKRERKKIENDLLKAITIMNNAFKSGRSIMQTVELVYEELDGPISDEFKKMFIDLTYGLELEAVFNRFADRVKLDEIKYMASSLVILNKTGGNVVKVFDSIEKGFFDRKKLQQELKSATALSELVFKVLIVIPILIFILVYIFNANYYKPLFNTNIGRIVLVIILVIYIIYILAVKKITKLGD